MKNQPSGRRSQQRLADLHRAVSAAVQGLHRHQLVVVTALRGDDAALQQSVLEDHRARVTAALQAVMDLGTFVDRCRPIAGSNAAEGVADKFVLRAG